MQIPENVVFSRAGKRGGCGEGKDFQRPKLSRKVTVAKCCHVHVMGIGGNLEGDCASELNRLQCALLQAANVPTAAAGDHQALVMGRKPVDAPAPMHASLKPGCVRCLAFASVKEDG